MMLGILVMLGVAFGGSQYHPMLKHTQIANGRPGNLDEGTVGVYESADGATLRSGDVLVLGVAAGQAAVGTATSYGNTVSAVATPYYTHIMNGTPGATMGKAALAGLVQVVSPAVYMAPARLAGVRVKVSSMELKGTQKRPVVQMQVRFVESRFSSSGSGVLTITDVDSAIRVGELLVGATGEAAAPPAEPEATTARDEALARLRDAKELRDLEVITPEAYDELRIELTPLIVGEGEAQQAPDEPTLPTGPIIVPSRRVATDTPPSPDVTPSTESTQPKRVAVRLDTLSGPDTSSSLSLARPKIEALSPRLLTCFDGAAQQTVFTMSLKRSGDFEDVAWVKGPHADCLLALLSGLGTTSKQTFNTKIQVTLTAE